MVVDHVTAGTMTSSPGRRYPGIVGLERTASARRLADDPLFTMIACFEPMKFANLASNSRTRAPMVTFCSSSASRAPPTSSGPYKGTDKGHSSTGISGRSAKCSRMRTSIWARISRRRCDPWVGSAPWSMCEDSDVNMIRSLHNEPCVTRIAFPWSDRGDTRMALGRLAGPAT